MSAGVSRSRMGMRWISVLALEATSPSASSAAFSSRSSAGRSISSSFRNACARASMLSAESCSISFRTTSSWTGRSRTIAANTAIGLFDGRDLDVAIGDGTVVALEQDRPRGRLLARDAAGGRPLHLDVLMDDLAVELDLHELQVRGLHALVV